jgi:hypothetical protein
MNNISTMGGILIVIGIIVVIIAAYKTGYSEGKHRERMNLLDILGTMPMMTELIVHSKEEYPGRYYSLYVVNYIIDKLRER